MRTDSLNVASGTGTDLEDGSVLWREVGASGWLTGCEVVEAEVGELQDPSGVYEGVRSLQVPVTPERRRVVQVTQALEDT